MSGNNARNTATGATSAQNGISAARGVAPNVVQNATPNAAAKAAQAAAASAANAPSASAPTPSAPAALKTAEVKSPIVVQPLPPKLSRFAPPPLTLPEPGTRVPVIAPTTAQQFSAAWARARGHRALMAGLWMLAAMVVVALLAVVWTPYAPSAMDMSARLAAPSAAHWLGTDAYGRDVLSQLMAGAAVSLGVGAVSVGLGMVVGVALGLWAAAVRGWVDALVMRLADFTFAFPAILCAVMLSAVRGPGIVNAMIAIGIFNVPVFARLARSAALAAWSRDFVLAARACGKTPSQITRDHIWGAVAPLVLVQAASQFALAVLAEAALSYLGLGTQAPTPSWGRMLSEAQTLLMQAPLLAVWPGLCIALIVWAIHWVGDGLRDLADPRTAQAASRKKRTAPAPHPHSPAATTQSVTAQTAQPSHNAGAEPEPRKDPPHVAA